MLKFNTKGMLIPDTNIPSDITELEEIFVNGITSYTRGHLFNKYISYSKALKELCDNGELIQWIDGSFATKKSNPSDIDLVTFVEFSAVDELGDRLTNYKFPASKSIFGVDAYIIRVYPPNHKFYQLYQLDKLYWMDYFTKTRRNRIGNKLPKDFLEINM